VGAGRPRRRLPEQEPHALGRQRHRVELAGDLLGQPGDAGAHPRLALDALAVLVQLDRRPVGLAGEIAELVAGRELDLLAELAARQPLDAARHLVQRADGAADDPPRQHHHQRERHQRHRDVDPQRLVLRGAGLGEGGGQALAVGAGRPVELAREAELDGAHGLDPGRQIMGRGPGHQRRRDLARDLVVRVEPGQQRLRVPAVVDDGRGAGDQAPAEAGGQLVGLLELPLLGGVGRVHQRPRDPLEQRRQITIQLDQRHVVRLDAGELFLVAAAEDQGDRDHHDQRDRRQRHQQRDPMAELERRGHHTPWPLARPAPPDQQNAGASLAAGREADLGVSPATRRCGGARPSPRR
jgi:hypothetical protein